MTMTVREIIMSTENKAPRRARSPLEKTNFNVEDTSDTRLPAIESMEVASLQIDESFDGDGDPYNNTGRFLVDAVKVKDAADLP